MKLNPNLKEFWRTKSDYRILKGGRSSSKTHDYCGFLTFLANTYKVKVLCMRQQQNKIQESVYATIAGKIEEYGYQSRFDVQKSTIKNLYTGAEFHFYGIQRNINEIKGFEGADIGVIEEAEGLTQEQWDVIDPTIRKDGSEIWLVYNPKYESDFIEELPARLGDECIVEHINYDKNPFLSDTMKRKIERMRDVDEDLFNHIYLGQPLKDDDDSVFKKSQLEACIDAHKKLDMNTDAPMKVGYDVADSGDDKNAACSANGGYVFDLQEWKGQEDELNQSCRRVFDMARVGNGQIVYDSIGVGAGCGSEFKDLNVRLFSNIHYQAFNAGGKVELQNQEYMPGIKNGDYFSNVKAQMWWTIADRVRDTYNAITKGMPIDPDRIISLDSSIPNLHLLIKELCEPKRKFDENGKVKVESKKDLAARGVMSPNKADAFIMALVPTKQARQTVYIPSRRR